MTDPAPLLDFYKQELARQQAFTPGELDYLRSMIITWIDEGFTRPPYDAEVYGILQKLGITQADVQYDIAPPVEQKTP